MQSNLLQSVSYKIKLPFLPSLCPFFQALFSLFFPLKGTETERKISCSSKSNNISTFYPEQAPLGVRPALLSIGKCNSLLRVSESYPITPRFGCSLCFFNNRTYFLHHKYCLYLWNILCMFCFSDAVDVHQTS